MIGYHCAHLVKLVSTKHHKSNKSSVYQAFQASSLMYLFLDQVWWFFKLVAQCKLWLATTVAHLVKPATLKHHATKQDVIFLSSVSSVKLDVPFLDQVWWFFKLVAQCKLWLATTVAHLVKPATLKHHATKQDVIFLSSVSSVKLDVPFSWPSVVVLQVGSTVANYDWLPLWHILWSQRLWNIMQQSNKSSVYQAFQASSLMYLFLDQVWWFFKLVAQCKLWLATTVHILWSQRLWNIMQQSKMSSFCQAFQASSLMYLFLTKCGGSSSW